MAKEDLRFSKGYIKGLQVVRNKGICISIVLLIRYKELIIITNNDKQHDLTSVSGKRNSGIFVPIYFKPSRIYKTF